MRGVNRVVLIGNLGKDPEIQYLEGNIPVAKFPLATTETYKDKTGKLISQTEWHNLVLWRGLAELAQKYLHKSSLVYIEGRLKTRYWEDRDHNKKVATEIIADNLIMLDEDEVDAAHLRPLFLISKPEDAPLTGTMAESLDAYERSLIERALSAANGNIARAARELGLDRANLHRKMRRIGLRRAGEDDGESD